MRLAGADKPMVCSVCLQPPMVSDPQPEYVNFESAYDGPVIDDPNGTVKTYIDKIVICEDCVRQGARLLGLDNIERYVSEIEAQEGVVKELETEIARKDKAIADLTFTVGTLMDHPVKRTAGRPHLRGPDTHTAELKEYRKAREQATKVSKGMKRKAASGSNGN